MAQYHNTEIGPNGGEYIIAKNVGLSTIQAGYTPVVANHIDVAATCLCVAIGRYGNAKSTYKAVGPARHDVAPNEYGRFLIRGTTSVCFVYGTVGVGDYLGLTLLSNTDTGALRTGTNPSGFIALQAHSGGAGAIRVYAPGWR